MTGKILVIEDEPAICTLLKPLIKRAGGVGTFVGTAAEALTALGQESFDLILCDAGLPDRSGYELLEDIAREGKTDARKVVMSGLPPGDDVPKVFDDFVEKPFSMDELTALIESAIRKKSNS